MWLNGGSGIAKVLGLTIPATLPNADE